jgi:ABC-type spermidine/putrescine transport system permease subunit II
MDVVRDAPVTSRRPIARALAEALGRWLPLTAVPTAVYLAALLLVPIGTLFLYSLYRASFFGVEHVLTGASWSRVVHDPLYRTLILRSIWIALAVCAFTIPLSFAVAYAITFKLRRGVAVLFALLAPMFASYVVRVFAWVLILGPTGFLNRAVTGIGLSSTPWHFLYFGRFAVALTLISVLVPLATLPIYSALQNVPRSLIDASRDLGESPLRTFVRVTLPLTLPAVGAAFSFVFLISAADYLTPQLLGGRTGFMVGRAIADQFGPAGDLPFGGALSFATLLCLVAALAIVFAAFWLLRFAARRAGDSEPVQRLLRKAARTSQRRGLPLGRIPWLQFVVALVALLLYAPLIVLVVMSFSDVGVLPIRTLTISWYGNVFSTQGFTGAILTSVKVAALCVALSLAIGVPAGFALARRRFRLKAPLIALNAAPLVVPGVVVGVAMLTALGALSLLPGFFPTVFAHAWLSLPFVVLIVQSRLLRFDRRVEEAARDLGSSHLRTLRTVTLPIIAPTLFAIMIVVWVWSMDEFLVSNFVVGVDTTLPVFLYSQLRFGVTPVVNAVASIMLGASLVVVALSALVFRALARRSAATADAAESLSATLAATHGGH